MVRRDGQQRRKIGGEVGRASSRVATAEHPFDGFVGRADLAPHIGDGVE
jgi:hypothetical protein